MEAREGQRKIDHAKALKNRVYGLIKQARPDEVTFRKAIRDMRKAMDEVNVDATGSIEQDVRVLLQKQVTRAQEKALERLVEINPSLSSIDQVEDIGGNPPVPGQVPSANESPDREVTPESGGASGFETVTGTGMEDPRREETRQTPYKLAKSW